jgi:hypothetical protein
MTLLSDFNGILIKRTKWLDLTISSGSSGWATTYFKGYFYADSNGIWSLHGKLAGTTTSDVGSVTLVVTNVTFRTGLVQTSGGGQSRPSRDSLSIPVRVDGGNSALQLDTRGTGETGSQWSASFDVLLDSEPLTYTIPANMEILSR